MLTVVCNNFQVITSFSQNWLRSNSNNFLDEFTSKKENPYIFFNNIYHFGWRWKDTPGGSAVKQFLAFQWTSVHRNSVKFVTEYLWVKLRPQLVLENHQLVIFAQIVPPWPMPSTFFHNLKLWSYISQNCELLVFLVLRGRSKTTGRTFRQFHPPPAKQRDDFKGDNFFPPP